jgi:hypothetical protein
MKTERAPNSHITNSHQLYFQPLTCQWLVILKQISHYKVKE